MIVTAAHNITEQITIITVIVTAWFVSKFVMVTVILQPVPVILRFDMGTGKVVQLH